MKNPDKAKVNLSLRYNQNDLAKMQLDPAAEETARELAEASLEEGGEEALAELAYLIRQEIFDQLKEQAPIHNKAGEESPKVEEVVVEDLELQTKIAYFRKLMERVGKVMQKHATRHDQERADINGKYLEYKELAADDQATREKLQELMRKLFSTRGKDPSALTVQQRSRLEKKRKNLQQAMRELKDSNPDIAALLQYDQIRDYARQLQETGFVWTESRREIFEKAMTAALSSRPVLVFMGESGTGKTALVSALARELTGMEPRREVGQADLKLPLNRMLVTQSIDKEGSFWRFNGLLQVMTGMGSSKDEKPKHQGGVFFDDEFNKRPASIQMEILKFVAEAKPGRKVTIPGTDLEVTVQPKFLYVAAGNPPSDRYEREETPVEAYRELSGVIDVDYLDQSKDDPELMEMMVAALLDQRTGRLRLVGKHDVMPEFQKDASGKFLLNEDAQKGGFLWRFANAWKDLFNAFSGKPTLYAKQNPNLLPEQSRLEKFILDPGKLRDWIIQYKSSPDDQEGGFPKYLLLRLQNEIKSYPTEDQDLVRKLLLCHRIDLQGREPSNLQATVLTPAEHGYLFPNVPRKQEAKKEAPKPVGKIYLMPDGEEIPYSDEVESFTAGFITAGSVFTLREEGMAFDLKPKKTQFTLLGYVTDGPKKEHYLLVADKKSRTRLVSHEELLRDYILLNKEFEKTGPAKPETNEHTEILKSLESQYPKRVETIEYFEFFEPGTMSIKGIDYETNGNKLYPMPSWENIRDAITPDHLEKIIKHIPNPHLLVVPIGMPLEITAQKIGAKKGRLLRQTPVYSKNYDVKADLPNRMVGAESLRYFVDQYTDTSGQTKSELLATKGGINRFPGWQVLVVSGSKSVDPQTLGVSPYELQQDFYIKGLSGMTPDEVLLWHGDNARDGTPADVWQNNSGNWNFGCYLTKSKSVPFSTWFSGDDYVVLDDNVPDYQYGALGGRPAVRIF